MNGGRGFLLTLANKRFVRARVARLIFDIPILKIWETSTETFNSQKQTSNVPQVFPLYWDDPCSKKSKQFKQQKFKGTKDYKLWISSPNKKKCCFWPGELWCFTVHQLWRGGGGLGTPGRIVITGPFSSMCVCVVEGLLFFLTTIFLWCFPPS